MKYLLFTIILFFLVIPLSAGSFLEEIEKQLDAPKALPQNQLLQLQNPTQKRMAPSLAQEEISTITKNHNSLLLLEERLSEKNQFLLKKNISNRPPLIVDNLITMMFETHPNIKMFQQIINGSEARVDSAKWNYFPTPSLTTNYSIKNIDGTTISLDQPLWTGGKLDAEYDMALAQKDSAKFGSQEEAYALVEKLLNELQNYLKANEDIVALTNGQERLIRLKEMIIKREDSGISSKADIELLNSHMYKNEIIINLTKNKKASALGKLELLIGQKLDPLLTMEKFDIYSFDISENGFQSQLDQHPTIKKIESQIEYAKAERSKAKAIIMPNISLRAQKSFGSNSVYYNNTDNDTVVYLSLQATPGAGLSSLSSREIAEAKVLQLSQEKNSKKQDIIDKTMTAFNNYTFANSRIALQVNSVRSSQSVFESYIRLFVTGKRQWLDLVSASKELTDNELSFNEAKVIELISSYYLALMQGKFNSLMRFQ